MYLMKNKFFQVDIGVNNPAFYAFVLAELHIEDLFQERKAKILISTKP